MELPLPPNARGCRRCRRQGSLGTGSPSCGQNVERQLASLGYSARLLASCYFLNVLEVSPFLTSPSPESSVMLVAQGMQKGLLGGWWYTSRGTGGTLRPSGLGPLIRTSPPSSLSAMREGHLYRLWKAPSPHMGKGRGTGGDAHGLTPQNTVPLPKAKFDPANREK